MNYFLLLTTFFSLAICSYSFAQDNIVTTDGKEIKARVLKINKKDVLYKVYDDPEFTTFTLLEKEIKTITTEKGKKYLFNHNYPRAFVSLNIDGFQPLGSFARTDFEKKEPGFAIFGLGGNLQIGFYLAKRLGLNIRAGASANRINSQAISDYYADPSDPLEVMYVNYNQQEQKQYYENWEFKHVMLGPMYSFKLATWLTVDTKLQVGFMNVRRPQIKIYAVDSLPFQPIAIQKYSIDDGRSDDKTWTAYGGGLAFRISPGRRIGFVLSADYIHTGGHLSFKESIYVPDYTSANPGQPNYTEVDRVYNIDQLKLSVGIAYQFKRKNR